MKLKGYVWFILFMAIWHPEHNIKYFRVDFFLVLSQITLLHLTISAFKFKQFRNSQWMYVYLFGLLNMIIPFTDNNKWTLWDFLYLAPTFKACPIIVGFPATTKRISIHILWLKLIWLLPLLWRNATISCGWSIVKPQDVSGSLMDWDNDRST